MSGPRGPIGPTPPGVDGDARPFGFSTAWGVFVIELLIGMVGSGKSGYARIRADAGALVVSHDVLTEMLHVAYRYEQGLREMYREMEEMLVYSAYRRGHDVVIDRTHLTVESRKRWVDFAHLKGMSIRAVIFPVHSPEVHATRRYEADPRGRSYNEWLRVAKHHHGQIGAEPVTFGEFFDEVRYVEMFHYSGGVSCRLGRDMPQSG